MNKNVLKIIKTYDSQIDYELIQYGLTLIKNDLIFLISVFLIGYFLNIEQTLLFFFIIFLPLRHSLPGFHCKTHLKCFIFSISFSLIISFVSNTIMLPLKYSLLFLSSFCIMSYTLILPMKKKQKFKTITTQLVIFTLGVICILLSVHNIYNLIVFIQFSLSVLNFKFLICDCES